MKNQSALNMFYNKAILPNKTEQSTSRIPDRQKLR